MRPRSGRLRAIALLAALALGSGACSPAQRTLSSTAGNLAKIRSGVLSMSMMTTSLAEPPVQMGFTLEGSFALPREEGERARADLEYTQVAGAAKASATFISTGSAAWIRTGDQLEKLAPEKIGFLEAGPGSGKDGGLGKLDVADWTVEPRLSEGPSVEGVETAVIRSKIDVPAAVNDLIEFARSFGVEELEALEALDDAGREQIERAVRSSRLEILTGREDKLLRRMVMAVEMGPAKESPAASVAPVRFEFKMSISKPNRPVEIKDPQ